MAIPPKKPSKRPAPPPKPPSARKGIEWPTSGRILRYTYGPDDYARVHASRPCIIVDTYESTTPDDPMGELYDVVVFTAGTRDFTMGREGWNGFLAKQGVLIGLAPMPGRISWPPRST